MIIAIEGVDQAGKKTQSEMLARALCREGRDVVTFEFPDYSTPVGKVIRERLGGSGGIRPEEIRRLREEENRRERTEEIWRERLEDILRLQEEENRRERLGEIRRLQEENRRERIEEVNRLRAENRLERLDEISRLREEENRRERLEDIRLRLQEENRRERLEDIRRLQEENRRERLEDIRRLQEENRRERLEDIRRLQEENRRERLEEIHHLLADNRLERLEEITAAAAAGQTLVMNRYYHSNMAYGLANGMQYSWLNYLDELMPRSDLVIVLDIDPDESFRRKASGRDAFEEDKGLLERVRAAYKKLAVGKEWHVLDASRTPEDIHSDVMATVRAAGGIAPAPVTTAAAGAAVGAPCRGA